MMTCMATAAARFLARLLHPTVHSRKRRERQKQQRVGRRMKREIKEAVNQYGKAAGQCSRGDAATKGVIGLSSNKARAKQYHQEGQAEKRAHDSGIRQYL